MEKSKPKTKKPLFAIEHDEELEKGIAAGGENARLLADNLLKMEVDKGHIKIPARKFTYEQASAIFANAKAIINRDASIRASHEGGPIFKAKSHKNDEGEYLFMVIKRIQ